MPRVAVLVSISMLTQNIVARAAMLAQTVFNAVQESVSIWTLMPTIAASAIMLAPEVAFAGWGFVLGGASRVKISRATSIAVRLVCLAALAIGFSGMILLIALGTMLMVPLLVLQLLIILLPYAFVDKVTPVDFINIPSHERCPRASQGVWGNEFPQRVWAAPTKKKRRGVSAKQIAAPAPRIARLGEQ